MKKNKMMRIASVLLIATLLTTCVISGTFAKYVTSDSVEDHARVAKFGVTVEGSGTLFSKTYYNVDNGNGPTNVDDVYDGTWSLLTIQSSDDDNVVAPGAKNDTGVSIVVTGAPEVDVKLTFSVQDDFKDIFLKAGTYPDMTTAAADDNFALANDYYPVVYTLKQGNTVRATGTLAEIAAFELYIDANTEMTAEEYTFTLTWEWVFGDDANNQADTLLGDLAAELEGLEVDSANYNLKTSVTFTVTVTQVD